MMNIAVVGELGGGTIPHLIYSTNHLLPMLILFAASDAADPPGHTHRET
jgi:hypothetical protein